MESRTADKRLKRINSKLAATEDQSLFGQMSSLHYLHHAPVPLTTDEMHSTSAEMIREARHEVLMMFYKFSADSDAGRDIASALKDLKKRCESQKSPVNVCLIINSRGIIAETLYGANKPAGLESLESSTYFKFTITMHPTTAVGTLHSKLILVDSEVAMVRGGDPHAGNDHARHQFETAALVKGPLVKVMRQDFCDVWNAYAKEPLHSFRVKMTSDEWDYGTVEGIPCLYLSKRENGNPLYLGRCTAPYKIALLQAIEDAEICIDIMTSNINDPDVCEALAKACNRGVLVSILTGKNLNDSKENWWGGTNLDALAGKIVSKVLTDKLSCLSIRWATNDTERLVHDGEIYTVHAKYVCIDKLVVFTGSSPLDKQAMYYSREADVIFADAETARLFDSKFFRPNYARFRNYFDDAYFILYNAIEQEAKRIHQQADSEEKRKKAAGLFEILSTLCDVIRSPGEKLFTLLHNALPYLEIRTGYKPGMPYSYNSVMGLVYKYGLAPHVLTELPDLTVQSQKTQETSIQSHGLFPPPGVSRSKSTANLVKLTHDDEIPSVDQLSHSM